MIHASFAKLIYHTKDYYVFNHNNKLKAFSRESDKEVYISIASKQWEERRLLLLNSNSSVSPIRFGNWSLCIIPEFIGGFPVEVFQIILKPLNAEQEFNPKSVWFSGGFENCKAYLYGWKLRNNEIDGIKREFTCRIYSKIRNNIQAIEIKKILENSFEPAGEGYFLSKNPADYTLYSPDIITKQHEELLSEQSLYEKYSRLDKWQKELIRKVEIKI